MSNTAKPDPDMMRRYLAMIGAKGGRATGQTKARDPAHYKRLADMKRAAAHARQKGKRLKVNAPTRAMNYANDKDLVSLTSLMPANHLPTGTTVAKDLQSNRPFKTFKPKLKSGRPKLANPKVAITIRLDPEVMHFFRRTGAGWQTRIDAALREHVALASRTAYGYATFGTVKRGGREIATEVDPSVGL